MTLDPKLTRLLNEQINNEMSSSYVYLAMAAYNAGESRIMGAIMRSKTRDFWEMVRRDALPSETMNYIPKFLAASIIGHNPRKYGFDDIATQMMPPLSPVAVAAPVRLADIASASGVTPENSSKARTAWYSAIPAPSAVRQPMDRAWARSSVSIGK